jgi:hypothetical protein
MSHSITCKLNQDARSSQGQDSTTFFVSLGEKNYNFSTKQNEYTNYEAALFAKGNQVGFYQSALVAGSVIEVSATGILMEIDPAGQYKPKLKLIDAKLGFVHSDSQGQPQQQQVGQQQRAPVQQPPQDYAPQQPQNPNNAAYVQPQGQPQQRAPQPQNQFDQGQDQNIPF